MPQDLGARNVANLNGAHTNHDAERHEVSYHIRIECLEAFTQALAADEILRQYGVEVIRSGQRSLLYQQAQTATIAIPFVDGDPETIPEEVKTALQEVINDINKMPIPEVEEEKSFHGRA